MTTLKQELAAKKERETQEIFREGMKDCEREVAFWVSWAKEHQLRLTPTNSAEALKHARNLVNELLLANVE